MDKLTDFEVIDHGIDGAQYFQGCGTYFTSFEYVQTGCGDTFAEAVDDALDCIAQECEVDANTISLIMADAPTNTLTVSDLLEDMAPDSEFTESDTDLHYYVSIRYNVQDDIPTCEPDCQCSVVSPEVSK